MREAPSLYVVRSLINSGATVTAYDPVATREAQRTFGDTPELSYADSPLSALKDADALLIVTEWKEFRGVDLARVAATLRNPMIFDGRNIYDPKMMRKLGFQYFAIGR
jgi:UDPglucose 6-dehydrogenase